MSVKLTWDDLMIQNVPGDVLARSLEPWSGRITGRVAPMFLSRFGDWLLRREDGSTDYLDVLTGELQTIAKTEAEFVKAVNTVSWQEERLRSLFVYRLHCDGKIASGLQCYAFAPHPVFTGSFDLKTVVILSLPVWQSLCAQQVL